LSDAHAAVAHQHQFDSAEQQKDAATLGMWAFIAQEILFFGGLFVTYIVYRFTYPQAFHDGSHHLDITLGTINTAVLIGSSLTMALAVHAAQTSKKNNLVFFLVATLGLGSTFLGIKAIEYSHKFHEHHVPGLSFDGPPNMELFFSLYFAMTGLHAVHMIIGAAIIIVLIFQAQRGTYHSAYYTPVELFGLYWHFVDIIWIFLFPLLYLIGRH